jgi:uncharacterized membrane protein YkoI
MPAGNRPFTWSNRSSKLKLHSPAARRINLVLAVLLGLAASPLQAAWKALPEASVNQQRLEFTLVQQGGISRDDAAALVKRRYGGKILAISEVQKKGRTMYRVKGLSDESQVYVVFVDKQSGRISG